MNNEYISNIVHTYLAQFPEERNSLAELLNQLRNADPLCVRNNHIGHTTASGLIVRDCRVALIFHNKLQKHIQPGGHIENDMTLYEAAEREVTEETGMSVSLHPWHKMHEYIPINIDTHRIPRNEKKNEKEHWHHDFTYVFTPVSDVVNLQLEEVSEITWFPLEHDFNERLLDNSMAKIINLNLV